MAVDPKALDAPIESGYDDTEITLREYFQQLLLTLWKEKEEFNGKRPFGSSSWDVDITIALIKGGFIDGVLDENDCLEDCDYDAADAYITELIQNHLFA